MTTALLPIVSGDSGMPGRVSGRRPQADTGTPDDRNDFAGVLAAQNGASPAASSGAGPSAGAVPAQGTPAQTAGAATGAGGGNPQGPAQTASGPPATANTPTSGPDESDMATAVLRTHANAKAASADMRAARAALPMTADDEPAPVAQDRLQRLPAEFSRILAALPVRQQGIAASHPAHASATSIAGIHAQKPGAGANAQTSSTGRPAVGHLGARDASRVGPDRLGGTTHPALAAAADSRTAFTGHANKAATQGTTGLSHPMRVPDFHTGSARIASFAAHSAGDDTLASAWATPAGVPGSGFALPADAPGADALPRALTSPQWGADLGQQFTSLVRTLQNGSHTVELRLDPPELGPLRVTLQLQDAMVQAVFSSGNAAVRHAVEHALPQLQQQLEREGLSLGQATVDHQDAGQQGFGDSHNPAGSHSGPGTRLQTNAASMASGVPDGSAPAARRSDPSALVDTFA